MHICCMEERQKMPPSFMFITQNIKAKVDIFLLHKKLWPLTICTISFKKSLLSAKVECEWLKLSSKEYHCHKRTMSTRKQDHLRMNVALDRTITLDLKIVSYDRSLSSIGQKIFMIMPTSRTTPPSPTPLFQSKTRCQILYSMRLHCVSKTLTPRRMH